MTKTTLKLLSQVTFSITVLSAAFAGCSSARPARQPSSEGATVKWEVEPKIHSNGNDFVVDATATLNSPLANVLEKATDYDKYAIEDVPNVKEAHTIWHAGNDMIVWFHTQLDTRTAEYFVSVHVEKDPASNSAVVSWELVPKDADWQGNDNHAVTLLSGTWSLKTDPADAHSTRVVYHLEFEPNTEIPSVLLRHFINTAFTQEASALFELMAQ